MAHASFILGSIIFGLIFVFGWVWLKAEWGSWRFSSCYVCYAFLLVMQTLWSFAPFIFLYAGNVSVERGLPWWSHYVYAILLAVTAPATTCGMFRAGDDFKKWYDGAVKLPVTGSRGWIAEFYVWALSILHYSDLYTDAMAVCIAHRSGFEYAQRMTVWFFVAVFSQPLLSALVSYGMFCFQPSTPENSQRLHDFENLDVRLKVPMFLFQLPPTAHPAESPTKHAVEGVRFVSENLPQMIFQVMLSLKSQSRAVWFSLALSFVMALKNFVGVITGLDFYGFLFTPAVVVPENVLDEFEKLEARP